MPEPPTNRAAPRDDLVPAAEDDTWDEDELAPGTHVDQWVIEKRLGSGGFGTVYEARQPVIGKRVAIKVLARRFSVQPKAVARFVAEARIVNRIAHASIVDIFAFGTLADGRHYHVMELCHGENLAALLSRRGRLPLDDALPILRGIASALDAAHAQGGVHRDLKPENVIVTTVDGVATPKVIDFGIGKLIGDSEASSVTDSGALIGTPRYMSPEQCRGRDVDARSDVYSFGILAYEVLTGERPFSGEDAFELMLKHTSEPPRPPSALVPELGASVDSIVLPLLEKDRNRRPENLTHVVERLERSVRPSPRAAEPVAAASAHVAETVTPTEVPPVARRRWRLAAGAGATALAAAVVLVWSATRNASPRAERDESAAGPAAGSQPSVQSVATASPTPPASESAQAARATEAEGGLAKQPGAAASMPTASARRTRAARAAQSAAPRLDDVEDPFHR